MSDAYQWWRDLLAGKKPPIHEGDPHCGYFKLRDRRGLNKNLAPIKRPFVAAAIWQEGGIFKAEIAGTITDVDRAWPYVAKYPVTYEEYAHWHRHEKWPEASS